MGSLILEHGSLYLEHGALILDHGSLIFIITDHQGMRMVSTRASAAVNKASACSGDNHFCIAFFPVVKACVAKPVSERRHEVFIICLFPHPHSDF